MALNEQDLIDIQNTTGDDEDKYIKETAFKQQDQVTEESYEFGTIKITKDYAKQARLAIKNRIDGVADYTKERIDRIDANREYFENKRTIKEAAHQVFLPEIRNAVQDWMDDLYDIFRKLPDSIEIKARENILERHISRKIDVDEAEDEGPKKFFRSMVQQYLKRADIEDVPNEDMEKLKLLQEINVYHFRVLDVIKEFLKDNMDKDEFSKKLWPFLEKGILSGMFMVKSMYDQKSTRALKVFENEKEKGYGLGAFKEEVEKEFIYNFEVVDTRNIIHRKDSMDWIIEKINTNFWAILNSVLGVDNEPKKNAVYDADMLREVESIVFKGNVPDTSDGDKDEDNDVNNFEDVKRLDGDVEFREGHMIPFRYKVADLMKRKDAKKFSKLSNDSEITLPSLITCILVDDEYYPIRIQPEPSGMPYKHRTFATKDNDVAGMGLPEILEVLQDMINTNYNLFQDLLDMAIKGVTAIDVDKIDNPQVLNNLQAGTNIQMKDAQGTSIQDVIQIFRPDLGSLGAMLQVFEILTNQIVRTSRKGATGEKISPNPTATEFFNMAKELEKSVNRTAMDINDLWIEVLEDTYTYTLLTRQDDFKLKLVGYRLGKKNVMNPNTGAEENITEQIRVTKWIEVTPQEIYIDGIGFDIKALENSEKQAVENQQLLQFLNMVNSGGFALNPDGTTKVYFDETGQQLEIDMFGLVDRVAKSLSQEDIWKKIKKEEQPVPQPIGGVTPSASGGSPSPIPPLSASPTQGDLLGGSMNV